MKGNFIMQDKKSKAKKTAKKTQSYDAKGVWDNIKRLSTRINSDIRLTFANLGSMLAKAGVSANVVTIVGFVIGLMAINFLSMQMYFTALLVILINRVFDALDGAIARNSKTTSDFGVFLDATLDYIFYAGVIFGFALSAPGYFALPACFLLFGFTASACAMLAYAVVDYKMEGKSKISLNQSPFYLAGIAQGSETLIAFVIMCIFPWWFTPLAIIFGVLCFMKALSIIVAAYYSFVISAKRK